jgi:hypothetical protein
MIFHSKGIAVALFLGISTFAAEARAQVFDLEADRVHYNISTSQVTVYTSDMYSSEAATVTVNLSGKRMAGELEDKYGLEKGKLADFSIPYSRLYISGDREIFVRKTNEGSIQVTITKRSTQDIYII